MWEFVPDANARDRIMQTILLPEPYLDSMAQLFFWGALRENGISSHLREQQSMPDLHIFFSGELTIGGEVKAIRATTNPKNVRNTLRKANDQLKHFDEQKSGILFIKVLNGALRSTDDTVPKVVDQFVNVLSAAIDSHQYRSVGQIVISWDDYIVMGSKQRAMYTFRRRSLVLSHSAPRSAPLISAERLNIGSSVVIWTKSSIQP